ncbi:hypothetical protein [uncultured Lacinutrix sp.]|uniref:hypothetical protein n=1 Tax=uncultured Lacinutrix sp. TaxID=574032 RepID=UPI00261E0691|nr:hypothetical protein [uncultured Lacinutrix sp.]
MKKRVLKNLALNKNVVSTFNSKSLFGGGNPPNTSYGTPQHGCPYACKEPRTEAC